MRALSEILKSLVRKQTKKLVKKVPFTETKTFDLLKGLEGWRTKPYILNHLKSLNPHKHKSGLTVGAGFDLGQHSEASLRKMGLPENFIKKCAESGFLGINPDTFKKGRIKGHQKMVELYTNAKKNGTLPVFNEEELSTLAEVIYKPYENAARKQFDKAFGKGEFNKRSEEVKAILSLEMYHRGTGIKFNSKMLEAARQNDAHGVAKGIHWESRRNNALYILSKL